MAEDKEELLEDSEYSKKSEFNKAQLVYSQIDRCLDLRSKEMKAGYTTWLLDKFGNSKPQIINDSRKAYCSSVIALLSILNPELQTKEKKDFKTNIDKFLETGSEIFESITYKRRISLGEKDGKKTWILGKEQYIPEKGEQIMIPDPKKPNATKVSYSENAWDLYIDLYWNECVELCDEIFSELNNLIHSLDYFKEGSTW